MTTSLRKKLCLALVLPVVAALFMAGTPGPAQATPLHYNPTRGATFNNPYGGSVAAHKIVRKIVKTVDSVRTGHKIRIASWNFRSNAIANALIRAHRRGVSVRVIMDYGNWNPDVSNQIARRTHAALAQGDKHRSPSMTSWLKRCRGACRGHHGIAHTKFYVFDKVQKTKDVLIYGSANATELAATIQWNDVYTVTGSEKKYNEFIKVFNQMKHDRAVKQGFLHYQHGRMGLDFYPYRGADTEKDPVLSVLNDVRCNGTTRHTGIRGHTKIRIAQTATYGDRGLALAKRLATMQKRGCNIRLVYAMFGRKVLQVLRQAQVPLTHLAYDSDCNGIYDRYVHMKSMTISGVYAGNTHARYTWNGSANWTPVSLASDEVVGILQKGSATRKYSNWIDYLFTHVPASWESQHCTTIGTITDRSVVTRARALKVDPYALIRKDL
ncbi:MAG TPA: phospholipase D-like domain-containing protein [Nocardioides sp.]|jgi:phosphatidylserine/phosphatidylglycerophosphate/cardiolipin synthase-like enzyme|nr:phospholipase D-like domain-containing protein [Nocardioides sp.]